MVIETVQQNFYVDDCLKSAATETEAIHLIHDLIALCGKGGFVLEKWISNSHVVLQAISKEERAKELKMLDLDIDKLPVERALGFQCSVYDLLGFLAPVTLHAKIMQLELCKQGCSWDDSLPQDIWQRWKKWLEELELLATFSVDRCKSDTAESCDYSSTRAVCSCSRSKMDTMIKAELGVPLQESVFWTDSTSVLKYVNNEDRRFHTFVANRIATIRDLSDPK
ncbi:hypothetical protein WMY93_032954 [Mugilogobius chulae]|uniref:Uncharacterized protein n=1 Tax=Mugilogobius chulae TaxID=88201 RepID=A0AAW0MIE3_9GOBI